MERKPSIITGDPAELARFVRDEALNVICSGLLGAADEMERLNAPSRRPWEVVRSMVKTIREIDFDDGLTIGEFSHHDRVPS